MSENGKNLGRDGEKGKEMKPISYCGAEKQRE